MKMNYQHILLTYWLPLGCWIEYRGSEGRNTNLRHLHFNFKTALTSAIAACKESQIPLVVKSQVEEVVLAEITDADIITLICKFSDYRCSKARQ